MFTYPHIMLINFNKKKLIKKNPTLVNVIKFTHPTYYRAEEDCSIQQSRHDYNNQGEDASLCKSVYNNYYS